jgi:uncharacterized protein YbjT (DUF2867 family)
MKSNILITGATGKTGMPVVERLARMNVPFRAMVHSLSKKNLVTMGSAEVVVGDFGDSASLERALEGIERVYLLSPPSPDQFTTQTRFVDIAKKKDVKQIVKLSALGTALDSPVALLRAHAQIEEYIRMSGMDYTFLRPHFFMENLLMNAATVQKDGAIYSPLGEARISTISVQDIGAVTSAILTTDGHAGKVYALTGPTAVTYAEIADTLGRVIDRPVRYIPVSFEATRQGMIKTGMPEWFADDIIRLMKTWAEGKGSMVSPVVENIIGRKPVSLKEFFMTHRLLFTEQAGKAA